MTVRAPVLVLNASYEAISIVQARRAITLVIKGAARMQESYDSFVWRDMRLPSVILLTRYRKVPITKHEVTRRGILARDQYTCQYCLSLPGPTRLTLDHVVPRSRGGQDSWENLVTCCSPCNRKKANRLPEEAEMQLAKRPLPVTIHTSRWMLRSMGDINASWRKYLFY